MRWGSAVVAMAGNRDGWIDRTRRRMRGNIDREGVAKTARLRDLALLYTSQRERRRDGKMERARKAEKRVREERGGVREERQKDFTVCLTGRPEGHTHTHTHTRSLTHSQRSVHGVVGVADPQQLWAKLPPHVQ